MASNKCLQNSFLIFVVFCNIVLPSHSRIVKNGVCGEWCYEEEEKYKDFECDAPVKWVQDCISGDRQSPIDIPVGLATASSDIFLSPQYYQESSFEIVNNGHTAAVSPVNTKDMIMTGSIFDGSYIISSLHFHWGENNTLGSEHQISGKSYALELHIVHHKAQYADLDRALASDDATSVAVLGVFFEVHDDDDKDNEELQAIINLLEKVHETENPSAGSGLQIGDLVPTQSEIFNYNGSLTTPCCNQNVFWTVFGSPLAISTKQMTAFRNLKYHNGHLLQNNYRGPQPRNGRTIRQTYTTVKSSDTSDSSSIHNLPLSIFLFSLFTIRHFLFAI